MALCTMALKNKGRNLCWNNRPSKSRQSIKKNTNKLRRIKAKNVEHEINTKSTKYFAW